MIHECEHCVDCTENAIGEKIAFCEVWGDWKNITLGYCFGNCDMQYQEGKVVNKPMTNGDRIRAMTDEEYVEYLYSNKFYDYCTSPECLNGIGCVLTPERCKACLLAWLQQPVKEDAG